ncbi:methyl-accepting chemotaxis protein [Denitratisoma oestradiolicum]|uniref:Chemotaxis protein n=1 Tax=Denitratisoma oestradiolicum TaxID=311182 RepID=A0A6S6YA42_9PROT|nr:CHASE3 domain-containing protein [Denitratisoma oestradiolicum]TWO78664.1 chemotaxis protein [Denitratisoma oestradiolicum]CAB1369452.1 Chemotaxis protein [Denitratisoma oestradiolicum]
MKTSIGAKLWLSFLAILAILLMVGSASYLSTVKLTETAQWVSHTREVQGRLKDLLIAMDDIQVGQRGYVITGEESYLEPYQAALGQVDGILRNLKELLANNTEQLRRLERIVPIVSNRLAHSKDLVELRRRKGYEAAHKVVMAGQGEKLMDELREVMKEMEDQELILLKQREEEARTSTEHTVQTIIGGVLAAAVLVVGAGIFLTRHIARPLREVTEVAERVTAGELATHLSPGNRDDEVGALMRAFVRMTQSLQGMATAAERVAGGDLTVQIAPQSPQDVLGNALAAMVASLRKMTQEIGEGINVLAASASEIVASTTQVASSSAETATAVSQTMATVEEVKQTSQLAAEKARQVSESAQRTVEISKSGRKSVDESVESMHRIQEQMESIAESIVRLSEQGQAIGEIIATVNDLAEQSNLLAVNAAIEAAKAGDQGKGFAVVAQEVKSLAEQSKQATAQVRAILGDIQKATGGAVMATEQGNKAVEAGVKLSAEVGESIRVLAESIAEAARAATQIAVSAQQQLVGMDQAVLAIQNIREASSQNVASTRQTEGAAQNLHELGVKLKQLVARYRA